jgi:hypothetical protein
MNIDPTLKTLVSEIGNQVGLEKLSLDEEGFSSLRFDDRFVINLQAVPDDEALMLYTDLGAPASGDQIYADLLRANLFWRSTMGATLSLSDDATPHVILAREFSWRHYDFGQVISVLETFVNTAEDWSELVQSKSSADERPPQAEPSSPAHADMIRI